MSCGLANVTCCQQNHYTTQELERNIFRRKRRGVVATAEQGENRFSRVDNQCNKEMTLDIE